MWWRAALINQTRGLLAEYGIVLPKGAWRFRRDVAAVLDEPSPELTPLAIGLFRDLLDQLRELEARLAALDRQLVALCRQSEACRRPRCRSALALPPDCPRFCPGYA